MLRALTEDNNNIHVKCLDLTCDNLPTFAGIQMVSLDNVMHKPVGEELARDKIMLGDSTNIIKESLVEIDPTGNINIPLDQGYFINSQPILFQDNANASAYKVDKAIIGTELKCNNIVNVNALDNMTILTNAEIKIKTSKLDAGIKLIGKSGNTSQIAICNDTDENLKMVMGWDSVNSKGVIACVEAGVAVKNLELSNSGSTILSDSELRLQKSVNPLVFQHAGSRFSTVINTTQLTADRLYNFPNVSADANVVLTQGAQTKTGALTFVDQLACQSFIVVRSNNANDHIVTSGSAPAASYNHFLQEETGTVAHTTDVPLLNESHIITPIGAAADTFSSVILLAGFSISRMLASVNIDLGTTGDLVLTDDYTLNVMATLTCAGTGGLQILETSTFANIPATSSRLSLSWLRSFGAGTCNLDTVAIYRDI
jgi:hypothetical protein